MATKRSLSELLSSFASRIDDKREQDGIRGYLKILKDLTNTDMIFVAKVDGGQASVVVGLHHENNFDEFDYKLQFTPCDLAYAGSIYINYTNLVEAFPNDPYIEILDAKGYIGMPLCATSGKILGVLVGINHHQNEISSDDSLLFQMVAQLIQAEFQNLNSKTDLLNKFDNVDLSNIPNMGNFFYSVLEHLPGSVSVISTDNKFVYVNKAYAEFFDLVPNDLIGKHIKEIFPPEMVEVSNETDAEVIKSKHKSNFSYQTSLENGDYYYSNVTKFPFINSNGKVFAVGMISIDITDFVKNRRSLNEEKLKNIQSSKLATIGEMTAGLTHELANPLTIIQGLTDKLDILLNRDTDKEVLKSDIFKIRNASERMGKLISSLRAFSRDDAKTKFEKIKVKDIIDVTLNLITYRFEQENINFDMASISDGHVINAQMVLVSQVLVNLLMNSIDAISELDDKWIKLEIEDNGKTLDIRISDSGKGIPDETVSQMFQAFYTTKELGRGTGLGLSLCIEIMHQHNAELTYELYKGHTSFLLKIPKA